MNRSTTSGKLSDLCVNVAECEDLTHSPPLMKRSAADACFADSASESDDAPTHKRLVSSNSTEKTTGTVQRIREGSIESGKLLGLEAWLETAAQQPEERTLDEGLAGAENGGTCLKEQGASDSCKSEAGDMTSTKEICGLSTPVTGSPKTPPREESSITEGPNSVLESRPHTPCDQGGPRGLPTSPKPNLTIKEDHNLDEGMSSSDLSRLFSTPKPANSKPETREKYHSTEETNEVDDKTAIEPVIEFSGSDPKGSDPIVFLSIGGDLIVRFPRNARLATYRIDANFTVYVDDDYIKGWSTILLPGLPRLQAGETGSFLFLIPQDRGFEFRTKHMRRCEVMEGCFFAEFISTGGLAVSMRSCGRRFYGFLKDFVLDQEIVAHRAVANSDAESDGIVSHYAICSLILNHRFICSEKCGFSIYVNGGPDGFFICKLEHQKAGLQMIKVPRGDSTSTGISRIQVICSPKDLRMFCLAWSVSSADRHSYHWLPRIYPASSSLSKGSRSHLRDIFLELNRGLFEASGKETNQLDQQSDQQPDQQPDHEEMHTDRETQKSRGKAKIGPDNSGVDHCETDALLLFRLLMSALKAKVYQLINNYVLTTVLSMSRMHHRMFSRMKHLTLAFVSACVLLAMSMWHFNKNAELGGLGLDQGLLDYFGLGDLYPGNHTADAELSVCYYDSIFNEDHNIINDCSPPEEMGEPDFEAESNSEIEHQVQESTDGDHETEAKLRNTEDPGDSKTADKTAERLSLRDKIDRWLGWKGPINDRV